MPNFLEIGYTAAEILCFFSQLLIFLVLFCSLAVLDPRVGHTMDVLSPFIPVHVLMLSIQTMRGLPRLRAPGIVSSRNVKIHWTVTLDMT